MHYPGEFEILFTFFVRHDSRKSLTMWTNFRQREPCRDGVNICAGYVNDEKERKNSAGRLACGNSVFSSESDIWKVTVDSGLMAIMAHHTGILIFPRGTPRAAMVKTVFTIFSSSFS